MNQLLINTLNFRAKQRGVSILEVLLVISLMSSISVVGGQLAVEHIKLLTQNKHAAVQDANVQAVKSFLDNRLQNIEEVGLETESGSISPVSVAGDQFFFKTPDGDCHRIAYIQEKGLLMAGSEKSGDCEQITPTVGANAENGNSDPFYLLINKYSLAQSGFKAENQPVFSYYDISGEEIPVDEEALSTSSNPVYENNLSSRIAAIEFNGQILSPNHNGVTGVPAIEMQRRVYLP